VAGCRRCGMTCCDYSHLMHNTCPLGSDQVNDKLCLCFALHSLYMCAFSWCSMALQADVSRTSHQTLCLVTAWPSSSSQCTLRTLQERLRQYHPCCCSRPAVSCPLTPLLCHVPSRPVLSCPAA
jgi:hypothetical protein